ncbi:DmX-like protein 2 [Echinococcus granulosus]|uniref:DmX-like protein 2 n=1 Tax=Echinococcus granulosus TaxID=6210 RepID=W6UG62_ECHGR|nr:DmX-like protein 2 [Echinococcus granulosus]EUB57127.1 DmX-like protein 2 [Echinococcus granulosus]
MRLHQVITGSRNKGHNSISFLNFSGSLYIVYGRGGNIVVLDRDLFQVQLIPDAAGADSGEITCICCENLTGLIAVSDGKSIMVFETAGAHASKTAWKEFSHLCPGSMVTALAWFPHSSICKKPLLLIGSSSPSTSVDAHYYISGWQITWPCVGEKERSFDAWQRLWTVESNGQIECLRVSPDGRFIAAQCKEPSSKHEEEVLSTKPFQVQIWCQTPMLDQSSGSSGGLSATNWVPSNLRHPKEIVAFSWRSMPRYLPPLTLPANACRADVISGSDLPFQLHEPMKGNKFVLAASINVTDSNLSILSPNYDDLSHKGPCSLQWMNNKTIDVERKLDRLLQHLILLISSTPIGDSSRFYLALCIAKMGSNTFLSSVTEHGLDKFRPQIGILDQMLLRCLSKWRRMHDTLLMLHPSDGSLFLWSINGLDCSTLNGSMLCSFAHKFCDGSVCADGLTNRARDAIEADITQNRRVCQTSFSLRSRLPGTDFSHVTPVAVHNSLLFTCVFENGSVTTMQSHMLLIDCFMARSKLALAVSSKLSSSVRNRYLQDIRGVQLACTTAPELRGPLILDLYSSAALDGSTLKHQEVGCSALMHSATNNTLPLSVIAVDSSTEIQLFSVDTTGTVTKIGNLTPTMDASLSSSSSMLLVISAPSSSSSFLVIKIFSTVEHNTGSLCRIETWRVDLDSKQVINGHATTTEALQARYRSSSLSPSSIIAGSSKISDHVLPLEPGVTVTCIKQGPSPISWCNEVLRPSYLIATTCSDGGIRLWTAEAIKSNCKKSPTTNFLIKWVEWRLPFAEFSHSRIFIPSDLLAQRRSLDELHKSARNRVCLSSPRRIPIGSQHNARAFVVACATNWRIAIGCAMGQTDPLMIVILECESSGGLEWMLEDIVIPSVELCPCHITSSELSNPILPQFHPRQLLEWMNLGRFRLVQALLVHLTRCLSAVDVVCGLDAARPKTTVNNSSRHQRTRSISLAISGGIIDASLETSSLTTPSSSPELEIPPLPLHILLALDSLSFQHLVANSSNTTFDNFAPLSENSGSLLNEDLATELNDEETSVQIDGGSDTAQRGSWRVSLETLGYLSNGLPSNPLWDLNNHQTLASLLKFDNQEARILSDLLSRYRLPGLSRLDQMYLLGIAELMANTRTEVTDRLSGIVATAPQTPPNFKEHDQSNFPAASELELDDCGLRFVMIMQLYSYLCGTIPLVKRSQMMKEGLTSRSFVWAFHSGADEVLLSFLPSQKQQHHQSDPTSKTSGGLTWAEFRRYGCGWWIHSDVILMQCAEKMARSEFLRTKDPMDSAIFYLAMHKPTVMASLFKSLGNRPLENFFRSDFTLGSPACKQAKLNAFRLLSQHKYVQAAALFLVGGWLEDAIKVCVDSVKDLQLAVVVCRLYSLSRTEFNESSISPYHKLLRTHVISHEDPYLRSIAYWVLMEPLNALTTLLQKPSAQIMDTPLPSQCPTMFPSGFDFEVCPSVFKLYTYIRSHPLVARHLRLTDEGDRIQSQLRLLDRRLYFRTAYHYNTIGCPTLTLEVLSRLPHLSPSDAVSNNLRKSDLSVSESQNLNEEVQLSFFKPNEDVRALVGEGDFEVVWSDEEEEAKRSDFTEVTDSLSQPSSAIESNILQHGDTSGNLDNAASHEPSIHLQMEYWACLRIFTEELCGMFSTASAEGGRLKKHIFTWIENGIAILQKISFPYKESYLDGVQYSFHVPFDRDNKEQSLFIPIDYHGSRHLDGFVLSSIIEKEQSMTSHLPAQTDQQEMCDNRFYFCLLSNLEFVQSLITFCSLHGESGVDLRVVRMELTYLLMDVFSSVFERSDFSSQSRFLRSLPLLKCVRPTAFPGFMSLISRPLDLIKTLINDINASLVHLAPPYLRFIRTLPSCSTKELHSVVMADGSSVVRRVGLLRNLCMTLSAYVFQCLSTGTWRASHQGNAGLAIAVTQSAFKSCLPGLFVSAGCAQPTSSQHSLLGVLAEAMVAVYMGLCVCALYARDSCALYRLAWNARLAESLTWSRVFGGVCRLKPLRPPAPPTRPSSTFSSPAPQPKKRGSFASSMQSPNSATQMGSFHFQVDQIAPVVTKIYLAQPSTHADEWFLPPQCSMMTCFLNKPRLSEKTFSEATFVYDSEDSSPPSDYDDYETATKYFRNKQRWTRLRTSGDSAVPLSSDSSTDSESTDISEDPGHVILLPGCDLKVVHLNPDFGIAGFGNIPDAFSLTAIGSHKDNSDVSSEVDDFERIAPVDKQWSDGYSYAWRLMRLAFVQLMTQQLTGLIKLLNLDNDFLTTYAPSLLQSKGLLDRWIIGYTEDLTFDCDKDNELDLGIPINHPPEKGVYNGDFGAPPGATLDDSSESALPPSTRRAMAEMAHLLNPSISPFQTRNPFSLPVKRLWFCLMSKPGLSETFMRWIYHPRHSVRPSVKPIKLQVSRRSSSNANVPAPLSPSARKSDPASKLSTNSKETEPHIGEAGGIERSTSTPAQHEFSINLIHREMEPLLCMCVDRVGYQYVALATPKQLIEISISNLLSSADWLFDDFEYDLESMRNADANCLFSPHLKSHCRASASDFIICEKTPLDLADQTHEPYEAGSQDLRGLNSQLVLRRSVSGVQKLSAHPLVPFYLCGTASGSVHVLQWNSEEPVVPMLTNTFAFTPQGLNIPISTGVRGNPVSVLHIDTSGKRVSIYSFGCGDTTGNFGLWNLDFNGSNSHPYFNCRSHGKGVLDFAFLEGSSMTFATVGVGGAPPFTTGSATGSGPTVTSTATRTGQRILTQSELEAANLIIWDALLPSSRAAVMACTCVAGIPSGSNERQLAVGTKRGEVAILDLRRRPAATLFNPSAHEGSALRSISCDSATNTLVTAGADGLVKVWRLSDPRRLLATFRSDGFGSHGSRAAATASIAAAALFRGNQSAAVAAASRPGISEVVSLPLTSIASVASETESLQLLTTRFLACGVDGCLQLCSVTPRPEPIWLSK